MQNSRHLRFLFIATTVALLLSLIATVTAIADDTPPEPVGTPDEPTTLPVGDAGAMDGETIIAEETVYLPELQEQLPENTSVAVVVDDEIEPLATQQALAVISVGDPIWCPANAAPVPGAGGCTASYANLSLLITAIENLDIPEPAEDGIIWITAGSDSSSSNVEVDGSSGGLSTWSQYSLTLQGGWDGSPSGNITGTSVFSVPITIFGWNGPLIINDISIANSSGVGLDIFESGDVTLVNVTATGNADDGISVEAGGNILAENLTATGNVKDGAVLFSGGTVFLSGTNTFSNNDDGLYVEADGDIVAENIDASGNRGDGTDLIGQGGVFLSGVNVFNSNNGVGLYVEAAGNIDIENLSAEDNGSEGIFLIGAGNMSLNGSSEFNNNFYSGLYAEAGGNIDVENLSAEGNGNEGVILIGAGNVSLSGGNVFDNNFYSGLYAQAGGDILAENLSASGNGSEGVVLVATGDVSLSGINIFADNDNAGLYVEASRDIFAENLSASDNGNEGVILVGAGDIDLGGINSLINNYYSGLYVETTGDILAANIAANGNGAGGTYGAGAEFYTLLGSFTLNGTNAFNTNYSDGLYIEAVTAVAIYDTDAIGNGGSGIVLLTSDDAEITCGILAGNSILAVDADLAGVLTMYGVNFDGNANDNIAVGPGQLSLVSNHCFVYPTSGGGGDDEFAPPTIRLQKPISIGLGGGQSFELGCDYYVGTYLSLLNGDGLYVPCEIADLVQLRRVLTGELPAPLSGRYLSGMNISVVGEGLWLFRAIEDIVINWFASPESDLGVRPTRWNGSEWVDITDGVPPFVTVFFRIPDAVKNSDLAIMYWNGTEWIELTSWLDLGGGRFVKSAGISSNGFYMTAELNFVGTFVLVEK